MIYPPQPYGKAAEFDARVAELGRCSPKQTMEPQLRMLARIVYLLELGNYQYGSEKELR